MDRNLYSQAAEALLWEVLLPSLTQRLGGLALQCYPELTYCSVFPTSCLWICSSPEGQSELTSPSFPVSVRVQLKSLFPRTLLLQTATFPLYYTVNFPFFNEVSHFSIEICSIITNLNKDALLLTTSSLPRFLPHRMIYTHCLHPLIPFCLQLPPEAFSSITPKLLLSGSPKNPVLPNFKHSSPT